MIIPLRDQAHSNRTPFVTIALILLNITVFAYMYTMNAVETTALTLKAGAIPFEVTRLKDLPPGNLLPIPGSLLTALFIHTSLLHLLGNIIFLWIFCEGIEDQLGSVKFLIFYLLMGAFTFVAHMFFNSSDMAPLLGSSGAIAGVMGAYLMRHPFAKIKTLVYLIFTTKNIKVPAMIFMGLWFMYLLTYASKGVDGGIAWYAHIGGLIFGIICITPFKPSKRTYI